ncbi:MAG: hypothetical protein NVV74_12780 [Magnetospirillum sp.]|nr:hypothetical protein [Magnetospirillum sp.]
MRVGLMGFGKTGRAVSSMLLQSRKANLQWVMRRSRALEHRSAPEFLGIDSNEPGRIHSTSEMKAADLLDRYPVDVIVDFSSEDGINYYGREAARRGIAIVSAVSKYSEQKLRFIRLLSGATRVVHSPNITLGVNFLIVAAKVLKKIAPYVDIEIVEEHFKTKPEVSGTAKVIASNLGLGDEAIKTIRAGGIVGVHEILFGFPHQTVRLKHESIAREAFGSGILFVIDNMPQVPNGLFTVEDLMRPYFSLDDEEDTPDGGGTLWHEFLHYVEN